MLGLTTSTTYTVQPSVSDDVKGATSVNKKTGDNYAAPSGTVGPNSKNNQTPAVADSKSYQQRPTGVENKLGDVSVDLRNSLETINASLRPVSDFSF
jgi:hypothetical protein